MLCVPFFSLVLTQLAVVGSQSELITDILFFLYIIHRHSSLWLRKFEKATCSFVRQAQCCTRWHGKTAAATHKKKQKTFSRIHSTHYTLHTTHHIMCVHSSHQHSPLIREMAKEKVKKNNMCCYTYHNCVNHLLTERVLNWAEKYGRLFVKLMIFFYSSTFCVRSYRVVCALYSVENGIRKRQKNMKKKLCSKKTNRGERIDRHDCWSMRHRIERELKKNTHRKEEEKEWIPRDRNRFNVNDHDECIDFFPVVLLFTLSTSNHTHTHSDTKKLPLLRAKQQQQQQKTRLTKGAAARISIRQAIRFYLSISLPLSLIL